MWRLLRLQGRSRLIVPSAVANVKAERLPLEVLHLGDRLALQQSASV